MKNNILWALLGLFLITLFYSVATYNDFASQNQRVENQWAQIEVQYQRRMDLIPNLVNAIKGLMKQERTVFENIAKARQAYVGARTLPEQVQAANQMDAALARLLAIVENYPELKSDQAVLSLMDELAGTENRISVERKRYNDEIKNFNIKARTFPRNMLAKLYGFQELPYFQADTSANEAPKVNLE